jgi:hypothetical protein
MTDLYVALNCIRNSFAFLWEDFSFSAFELKPREGDRNSGYEVSLENECCTLVFSSEGGILEEIYIRTKKLPYFGRGLKHLTKLLRNHEMKSFYLVPVTDKEYFDTIAQYIRPTLSEILEMAKTPKLFKETIETLESASKSQSITVEPINAERAHLHSLGLDSSLGAAMENLRKRGRDE